MSMFAIIVADFDDAAERAKAVAAAKVQTGWSGQFIGQQSIQPHGSIGMTMETRIGHYFRRLTMNEIVFGDTTIVSNASVTAARWCNLCQHLDRDHHR